MSTRPRGHGGHGVHGGQGVGAGLAETRWMLEELRVSLFAQTLGTQAPVSENRVLAALERLSG